MRILIRIVFGMAIATMGWPAAAGEPLTARVLTHARFAPSDVVIQAFIEPDSHNRSVSFEIDSETFYSRSVVELAGDQAPRTRQVTFRLVPAGSYAVSIRLAGTSGERGRVVSELELW